MSKKQRIAVLEAKVAQLEAQIELLRSLRTTFELVPQIPTPRPYWEEPWWRHQVTCGDTQISSDPYDGIVIS